MTEPADTHAQAPESANRILANTGFRAVADIGSKIASIALYVVMARRLGDAGFGVFTFGMAFVTLVTTFANMGQQAILTREVARDRGRVHEYFANTLSLQLTLSIPALILATGVGALLGFESDTRAVVLLLGIAVVAEALMSTCFAVFQAYERLGFIPIVLLAQRWATAAAGIAALALGAGVVTVSAIYLGGALGGLAMALYYVVARVARPRWEVRVRRWLPLMRVALPVGIAGVFATILFRIDVAMLAVVRVRRGGRPIRCRVPPAREHAVHLLEHRHGGLSGLLAAVAHDGHADRVRVPRRSLSSRWLSRCLWPSARRSSPIR